MRNIKFLTFILVIFITNQSWGQQETSITNYWSHMNLFNPAYVGSDNMVNFKSTIRNQWSGISESPVTQMFSYSKPFGDKVGLGLSIASDIIRSHGGNIKLDKSKLNGLGVKIFLPV